MYLHFTLCLNRYDVIIVSVMAYQVTSDSAVCSTLCSGIHLRKHQNSTSLDPCEGNQPVTSGIPTQRAYNAENVSMSLRHYDTEKALDDYRNRHSWKIGKNICHEDVIKWKYFPRYWPFVRGIHRSLICIWINAWVNNREAGDLRRHRSQYDVIIMVPGDSTVFGAAIDEHFIKNSVSVC